MNEWMVCVLPRTHAPSIVMKVEYDDDGSDGSDGGGGGDWSCVSIVCYIYGRRMEEMDSRGAR